MDIHSLPSLGLQAVKAPVVPFSITHEEFVKATNKWRSTVNQEQVSGKEAIVDLTKYFQVTDEKSDKLSLVVGYDFPLENIEKLVSSVGIQTIMVRFGIMTSPETNKDIFTVILYGFNNFKMRVSPYLVGTCYTVPYESANPALDQNDHLPNVLGDHWIDYWRNFRKKTNGSIIPIESTLFETSYGYLNGYNYVYNDFVDTLFPISEDAKQNPLLRVNFGLHRYFSVDAKSTNDVINTFGLVLDLANLKASRPDQPTLTNSAKVYYDFSAPCPPTC